MSEERVQIKVADHVAEVAMVRSDKHNALDGDMFEAIAGAAGKVPATEPGIRAVVLHGEGPKLLLGIDVGWLAAARRRASAKRPSNATNSAPTSSRGSRRPG